MTEFIQIEQHCNGICYPANVLKWLCEEGKTGRFLHFIENRFPQWEILVAIEDALIEAGRNEGWDFVVGRIEGDGETKGWLEYDEWVVLPYGPERASHGSDIGVWLADDFYDSREIVPEVWAVAKAAPESGIILNRILKEGFFIDRSLGS